MTAGLARKPGMSRDDLVEINAKIMRDVATNIKKYSPEAILIVVTNPLDVMTYAAFLGTGFPRERVFGMAGVLDTARYRSFIAEELNISPRDIQAMLMGGHGDSMVPLPRYTTVGGIPISELLPADKLNTIVERTKQGGKELVDLLGVSAWYAPGAAAAESDPAPAAEQAAPQAGDAKAESPANPEPKTPAPAVPDPAGDKSAPAPAPAPVSAPGDDAGKADKADQQAPGADNAAAQQNKPAAPAEQGQEEQGDPTGSAGSESASEQQALQAEAPQESSEEAPAAPDVSTDQGSVSAPREQAAAPRQGGTSSAGRPALAQTGAGTTAAWVALGAGATGAAMLMARRRLSY